MNREEAQEHQISIAEKAAVQATFAAAPDTAEFTEDVAAVVMDFRPASLRTMRSRGTGPRFRVGGKAVLYRKSSILEWQDEHMTEAANGAQAKAIKRDRVSMAGA
jgi:hypothetical protein